MSYDTTRLKKAFDKSKRTRGNVEELRDAVEDCAEFVQVIDRAARNFAELAEMGMAIEDFIGSLHELATIGLYSEEKANEIRSHVEAFQVVLEDDTDVYSELNEAYEEADARTEAAVEILDDDADADSRDDAWEEARGAASTLYDLLEAVKRNG